jgi:kinesin family protein 5
LEALLQDADRRLSIQNQKFEAQLQAVKERLDQARGMRILLSLPSCSYVLCPLAQKAASSSPLNFGRIAKPLRGGGGGAPTTSVAMPSPVSGGGLARLQNEEGCVFFVFKCLSLTVYPSGRAVGSCNFASN